MQQACGVVLVELQIRAAGHAERTRFVDDASRIQQIEISANDILERDEPAAVRECDETRQRVGHLQVGEVPRAGTRVAHHDREREPQVGNQREWMTGCEGHGLRRDDRKDLFREVASQRFALRLG